MELIVVQVVVFQDSPERRVVLLDHGGSPLMDDSFRSLAGVGVAPAFFGVFGEFNAGEVVLLRHVARPPHQTEPWLALFVCTGHVKARFVPLMAISFAFIHYRLGPSANPSIESDRSTAACHWEPDRPPDSSSPFGQVLVLPLRQNDEER